MAIMERPSVAWTNAANTVSRLDVAMEGTRGMVSSSPLRRRTVVAAVQLLGTVDRRQLLGMRLPRCVQLEDRVPDRQAVSMKLCLLELDLGDDAPRLCRALTSSPSPNQKEPQK